MCGIVGYVGRKQALNIALAALERMEYRGYDSAGIAVLDGRGAINIEKKAGKLDNLRNAIDHIGTDHLTGTTGIGHTRWATHGRPNDVNAHPHLSYDGKVAIVHNGIIENFAALREEVENTGIELKSETDSEVAAHLVALEYNQGQNKGDFDASVLAVLRRLEGAFSLLFTHADYPDRIIAARRSSPLIIGIGQDEMFLGSDVAAFIEYTNKAVEIGQDTAVTIMKDGYTLTDFFGNQQEGKPFTIDLSLIHI